MKKRLLFLSSKIDHLYLWVLAVDLIIAASLLYSRLSGKVHILRTLKHPCPPLFGIRPGAALALFGLCVLTWRIWMAWRYRACAPVAEEDLPVVTIVIPAYNEGRQVLPTVRSVMDSNYPPHKMQVICVDDGSVDDTWQWMLEAREEYPDRIQLLRQPVNSGKRQALMSGFSHAVGTVWVTIDSDSEVLPDTLLHLVSPLAADPRVGAVAGNVRVLNRADGAIPKMMEVFFTAGFDFIRAGQSVYGGVFCTPGALSAYRVSVIREQLKGWVKQAFLGTPATIGEDRALTNLVLKSGYRVVYQREAVVLTKIPATFRGLRRMLLRWARSNVRESIVMMTFVIRKFRKGDAGGGWIRCISGMQMFRLTVGEALKVGVLAEFLMKPLPTFRVLVVGCLISSLVPAAVYELRYRTWFGWLWAVPYSFLSVFILSWISLWALMSAPRSGWLTRDLQTALEPSEQSKTLLAEPPEASLLTKVSG
ncbi:MAG: glycosyltransferase [Deltaproteobacteria bacterium]|jgi:hyaluronan synthase|nr:glycosyltransferase [Deltaproteobacteria bacterium]MDA8305922.1 glycosyltransferase [Deltaproteobacteria bacterium]